MIRYQASIRHQRRTPVRAVRSAYGAIHRPAAVPAAWAQVPSWAVPAPPIPRWAPEPGLRSGRYPPPAVGPPSRSMLDEAPNTKIQAPGKLQ